MKTFEELYHEHIENLAGQVLRDLPIDGGAE